jgi:hypothetical protein
MAASLPGLSEASMTRIFALAILSSLTACASLR